jgi:hypothetical protein
MPQPKDVLVTVTVDTETITQENVNQTIVMTDDNGGKDQTPGDSCTFLSKINKGAQVTFQVVAKDGRSEVAFSAFTKNGQGPNVLNPMPKAPNWKATVSGAQKDKEAYDITVNVSGTDYTLDPGVQVEGP